ncbi:butyrophilin subfamily 1 member A1-like [Engraulis encrasicolus]|uniref:butyrophilin subfamily 1 member A1-like n=1 Tax=Engraulis encrasicolus TaxID=184585 RepID=UPI002FD00986
MAPAMWRVLLTLLLLNGADLVNAASSPEVFNLIGQNGPVTAPIGSSVTLPCALSPSFSAVPLQVRWHRPGSFQKPFLMYDDTQIQPDTANPQYQGRASLVGDLNKGEVSLKLTNITLADRGQYVCHVKSRIWYTDLDISLMVKVVGSVPVVWSFDMGSGQVNVTCESEGWSPQPTLIWRDSRGTHISSNSSNVNFFSDEDGLVSVRSWLLFSPSHSEWLSCSVGLSDQETTQSRVALRTTAGSVTQSFSGDPYCPTASINTNAQTSGSIMKED